MSEALAAEPRGGRARGVALAAVSAVSFSTLGIFARLAYSQRLSPSQALAWRFTIASLCLWVPLLAKGGWRRPAAEYRRAVLLGVLGFSPQAGLYFATVRIIDPGLASLLLYLYPVFVIVLSLAFFKRKPRREQLLALALSSAGCVLTLWVRGQYPALGYALGLCVALTYAAYLVASEKALAGLDPVFATACVLGSAAVVFWIVTLATGTFSLPSTGAAIGGVLGLAVLGSVVPIVTLFAAIKRIGSSDASLVSTFEPLCTVALSALFVGERLSALQLAGGACIVAGVVLLNLRMGNGKKKA